MFISLFLLEIVIRSLTIEKKVGYEYLLGKSWMYMLPFQPAYESRDTSSFKQYRTYDAHLGWDIGVLGEEPPLYYSDFRGFRCSESDYKTNNFSQEDTFDIICIGDSFTHGDAVRYEDTWTNKLGRLTGKKVLNMGVGAYGVDQAVLKFQQKLKEGIFADTVVLGLIAGDMDRSLTTVYNFYNGGDKTKPKFLFDGDSLKILNQPCAVNGLWIEEYANYQKSDLFLNVPEFTNDVFAETFFDVSYIHRELKSILHQKRNRRDPVYRSDDERLEYCMNIIKYLKVITDNRNIKLVVLLMGNNNTFADRKIFSNPWNLLKTKLDSLNIRTIDATEFQYNLYLKRKDNIIHPSEGVHYSVNGNEKLAQFISNHLID